MSKLIRFDEDHFGYLNDGDLTAEEASRFAWMFDRSWPGKRLIVIKADEFIDLTGKYEIVPIPDEVAA